MFFPARGGHEMKQAFAERRAFADAARQEGYDAIRYRSRLTTSESNFSLAIIQNPESILTPIGVYPAPGVRPNPESPHIELLSTHRGAFSQIATRAIQAAGIAGDVYAGYEAVRAVSESDQPAAEAVHQGALLGSAIRGGALGAARSLLPCARLVMAAPAAAPWLGPVCMAAGAMGFGYLATTSTEVAIQAASHTISAENAVPPTNATRGSTASMLSAMLTAQSPVVNSCVANIGNLMQARKDYRTGTTSDLTSVYLPGLSTDHRPSIYTNMMNRQVALSNASDLYSQLADPPPPSVPVSQNGIFGGGEMRSGTYCINGNCYTVGGSNDCRNSNDSRCTMRR